MSAEIKVRWGWLKFMYLATIVFAVVTGLAIIIMPDFYKSFSQWPADEPISLGIVGSVYLAFGILSIFGLRAPLKYSPILFLQLCYKVIWFIGVVFPLLFAGKFPSYAVITVVVFALFIVGDLIAIPFSYIFAEETHK